MRSTESAPGGHGLVLDDLAPGQPAVVEAVLEPGPLGDRLLELGLTPGAPVAIVRRAPFGDPLQIRLRGTLLAIRRAQARRIVVRLPSGAGT